MSGKMSEETRSKKMCKCKEIEDSLLLVVLCQGYLKWFKILIERCEDYCQPKFLSSLLYIASRHGHLEVVKFIVTRDGVDINSYENFETSIGVATRYGHLEVVEFLLEQDGIDVNKPKLGYGSPIHVACQCGHLELVQLLLAHGNGQEAATWLGLGLGTAPMVTDAGRFAATIRTRTRTPPLVKLQANGRGDTALIIASRHGQDEVVKLLLARGFRCEAANKCGDTALLLACQNRRLDVVQTLLKHGGVDVNQANNHGDTALLVACKKMWARLVRLSSCSLAPRTG